MSSCQNKIQVWFSPAYFLYAAESFVLCIGRECSQCTSGACPLQQIHGYGSVSIGGMLYKHNMGTYFGSSPISPARYYLVMLNCSSQSSYNFTATLIAFHCCLITAVAAATIIVFDE